jgi:bacterioferritin-associated ferredoxin
MLVCHCQGLSDRDVRQAVRSGARSRGQVTRSCGAGGRCGGCRPLIEEILADELSADASGVLELAPAR